MIQNHLSLAPFQTALFCINGISLDNATQRILGVTKSNKTFYGDLFDVGWPNAPHRVLRNKTVDAWEAAGRPASGNRPGEGDVMATTPRGEIVRYVRPRRLPTSKVT